ncbi:OB-fold nucleic acid binding domain-containing protein [Sporichthya polymorpha]|uniref:OB-fold nucleic acid binding domain-containing protein n=1 Tax=Sporichthya polymorpha TaxID=35751 RepID=UPI000366C0AD|nr:OB-fold nucleic acid binding domain-containing protein [Sporichthya polymorpha]
MTTDAPAKGLLKRMIGRITAPPHEVEARELQEDVADAGGTPIQQCCAREIVTMCGTLRTVTLRPRAGVPALEAELYDGSGTVSLVWLGRRQIAGVEPGRGMKVTGRVAMVEGRPVVYNPRYELRPGVG